MKAKKEIKTLSKDIEGHDRNYYNLYQPTISDKEYDLLIKRLTELEDQFPEFKRPRSSSQRVGVKLPSGTRTVQHRVKMYSLDNTYSVNEIKEWSERVYKGLGKQDVDFVVELKMDGISAALTYENGHFALGATRGDGVSGEDVSHSLKTIKSIPLTLKKTSGKIPTILDVRSEIFMYKKDFQILNEKRMNDGEEVFVNARNATSGSVKLLDSRITAQRNISCFIHSFGVIEGGKAFETQWQFLKAIKKWGLPVNNTSRLCSNIDEVTVYCNEFQNKRNTLGYEVDGVVIKVNSLKDQEVLGTTLKSPRWAVAFKFPASQATTIIKGISIQIGRTGVLTPVAELEPVECGGVTISRSTLHNFDEVKRLGVAKGDRVLIERAGDVIPKIVKVVESSKGPKVRISVPKKCPECGGKIVKEKEGGVAYRCQNLLCPKKLEKSLLHFSSRGAMDIEGLGESVVGQLFEQKLIKDLVDIYFLNKDDLMSLELFAEKKAINLLNAINESKNKPLSKFIFALGIPNVGAKASFVLAQKFRSLNELIKVKSTDLEQIYEIGSVIAESVTDYFKLDSTSELIGKFKKAKLNLVEPEIELNSTKFVGRKFVFTGEFSQISRTQASDYVKKMGGEVVSTVSKKTDYVVVGSAPGSKYQKALDIGVQILDEKQFQEMLNV